jgi:hypothetical protein
MKKTIFTVAKLCSFLLLTTTLSCSEEEELLDLNEAQLLTSENVSARVRSKKISGCDNPKGYKIYTIGELDAFDESDDYVPKKSANGTNVDVIRDIDDRTCQYNYTQEKRGKYRYGKYRLKAGTNKYDALQPRIERTTLAIRNTSSGFVRVSGHVRIRKVGDGSRSVSSNNETNKTAQLVFGESSGTYIMQAKGTHSGGGGSKDPAILLLLAKPASNGDFNIYSEQITKRGGSDSKGRELVYVTTVKGDRRVFVNMTNRFSNGKQYVDYKVGNVSKSFKVPDSNTQKGQSAKIRFGAYRCKKGEADIWWSDVSHNHKK